MSQYWVFIITVFSLLLISCSAVDYSSQTTDSNCQFNQRHKGHLANNQCTTPKHVIIKKDHRLIGGKGGLPPRYLSVKNWKSCVSSQSMGTWTAYCLPKQQPKACTAESWKALQPLIQQCRT